MDEEKFGAVANFNSNRQQLEKIKKTLEEKSSTKKEAVLKSIAEEGGKKEIKKSVGADINKNPAGPEKLEKSDLKQAALEKRIREILPEILSAEAIEESINANIASEKKAEKARKIIGRIKDDLNSAAKDPEWYQLKWRDDELKNALKRHFIKKATHYFNAERLTGIKKFHNYLEGLCKVEKKEHKEYKEQKEHKEKPLSKEKKEFLENLGKEFEKGVLEKLSEDDKEAPGQKPAKEKEFVKLKRITPSAKEAIYAVRKAFEKNENLKKEDIPNLLQSQERRWEYLTPREQDLVITDFERLVKSKRDQEGKFGQKTKEKEIKETITERRGQLAEDEAERKPESSGKYYIGTSAPEDAKEESIKLKNGKKIEEKKEQEKIPQKQERTKEDIGMAIKAAAEVGDEETMKKLEKELEDFDKTGEQPLRKMEEIERERAKNAQREINDKFPPKKEVMEQEIKRPMEEIEKERAEKAQEEIDKYFPKTKKEAKEADEKIKEFFSKGAEEVERKGIPLNRQEELKKLKEELEQARKDYLEVDYKKKKAYKRLYDFFGSVFKGKKEHDKEVAYYRAHYDNKLFEYKNALLEDTKARGASGKELGELVKFFDAEAKINLDDTHTQVKIENQEKRFFGFIKKSSTDLINWYRRLPMAKKIAVGAAFGLGSVGAVYAGGAVAGIMASAAAMRRVFLGAVTGTTVAVGAEAFTRRRTEKGIAKEAENFARQAEGLSEEERIKMADARIKGIIYDERREINKIKNKNLRNLALGIAAGAGGALLPKLLGGRVAEFFGYHTETPSGGGKIPFAEMPKTPGAPIASEIPAVPEVPEVSPVSLAVEKGSSLEGTLIDYIKDHQAEIYDHHPELKNFDPGQIAHRMYLDYLHENANPLNKSLDLVYPGAEIEIDPATLRISEFADTKGAIGRAIEQAAGNHEKWAGMKNLSLKELAGAAKNKIMGLSGEYGKFWGPEAEVRGGEKIKDWLARVVRLAAEKK